MKNESFSDQEDALLVVKLQQNIKENSETSLGMTKEAASAQEGSSFIIFDFKIKNEKCDEVLKETENTFVKIKTEQNSDSTKDDIISKFSESDDETVDCSEFDAISLKNEKEPKEEFQQINSKLEGLSEKRTSTEEQHEVSKETEKLFIKVKSEQSDDSPQDGIISKFSESDDETVNCSGHDVMNLKKENKPKEDFQQMNSGLEILSDPKTYVNNYCGKKFLNSSNVKVFNYTLSSISNLKTCKIFQSRGKPYRNVMSAKELERNTDIKLNVRPTTGKKPYRCVVCGKEFGRKTYLKIHHRIHTGEKPYRCAVCSKEFRSNSHLKTHLRIHTGKKQYSCVVCGKEFQTNGHLKTHHRTHTGEKPYSCLVCSRKFARNDELKIHQRTHTGERPYSCVVCGKKFKSNGELKVHHRIHTGEKPYGCVVCGKEFGRNSYLKTHERIHTGEKPYSCVVCNKKFGRNSDLKKHEKIHTGEKPYKCVVCGKEFLRRYDLKIHKNVHTWRKTVNV